MLIYLLLIWWMDKYDREPMLFVFFIFLGRIRSYHFRNKWQYQFLPPLPECLGGILFFIPNADYYFAPFSEEVAKGSFLIYNKFKKIR